MTNHWIKSPLYYLAASTLLLYGCASTPQRIPVPEEKIEASVVIGFDRDIRYFGDSNRETLQHRLSEINEQSKDKLESVYRSTGEVPDANLLALSGGSDKGAYGAGLLVGWSEKGDRPEFDLVTGVSTGAIIAPFAFLGSQHDSTLIEIFTQLETADLFNATPVTVVRGIFGGSSITSTAPLKRQLERIITPSLLKKIASAHSQGRRLLIATTNLEAGRPVIWDVGKIATSNNPRAAELVREIIRASAAIPGVFPAVLFDVNTGDNQIYSEIHVDGGATNQVFLYPFDLKPSALPEGSVPPLSRKANLYIINNGRIDPVYQPTETRTLSILLRSTDSLIRQQSVGDLYRIYLLTQRDGIEYKLAYIPESFTLFSKNDFNPEFRKALFEFGKAQVLTENPWQPAPPGL